MATSTISFTRGDSAGFLVSATYSDGTARPFVAGDKVYFTVKKSVNTADIEIQKIITEFTEDGRAHVAIDPIDTKNLDYGSYKYDIQLTTATGTVATIVQPSILKLNPEVTFD